MANRITASLDYIFQKIAQGKPVTLDGAEKRTQARNWYRNSAAQISSVDAVRAMSRASEDRKINMVTQDNIGQMMMFWYDAKLKKELPYWDRLPLIFPLEVYQHHFLGINLHYLSLPMRAKLMDALYTTRNNRRYDKTTKLMVNYRILKGASKFEAFRPCLKMYLKSHVQSKFVVINPDEWDMALMLPTERFQKARKQTVWANSTSSLRK